MAVAGLLFLLNAMGHEVRCFSLRGQSKCLFLDGLLAFELNRAHVPEREVLSVECQREDANL